jgi:hypothetical protein
MARTYGNDAIARTRIVIIGLGLLLTIAWWSLMGFGLYLLSHH